MAIPEEQPPESFTDEQAEYLNRMFREARLADANSDILVPLTTVPDRPLVNKLYYFAAPIPAAGIAYEGVYIYKSDGRWWALADLAVGASWTDYLSSLADAVSVGSPPTLIAINGGNYQAPAMNGTPVRRLQTEFHINHDIAQGSDIFPHVHWTNDTALVAGQTLTWLLNYQVAPGHDQGNFGAPTAISISYTVPAGGKTAWRHFITEGTNPLTQAIPAPEIDSVILMTIELSANTMAGNVLGVFVDLHTQTERLTSVDKAPDFYT